MGVGVGVYVRAHVCVCACACACVCVSVSVYVCVCVSVSLCVSVSVWHLVLLSDSQLSGFVSRKLMATEEKDRWSALPTLISHFLSFFSPSLCL